MNSDFSFDGERFLENPLFIDEYKASMKRNLLYLSNMRFWFFFFYLLSSISFR